MRGENKIWHKGGCHCGAVRFEVRAARNVQLTACNCSICQMTGFQHLIVEAKDFRVLCGGGNVSTYRFNTYVAKHTFCKTCGIKSFYTPRSHPEGFSVNFRCVDQSGFEQITSEDFDGQNWESHIETLQNP